MFRKNETSEQSNFWISYADLMAGLLFVFILLIGAIISKSIILKSNLESKEQNLVALGKALETTQALAHKQESELSDTEKLLLQKEKLLVLKNARIAQDSKKLNEQVALLKLKDARIAKEQNTLAENERLFKLKTDEISALNALIDKAKHIEQSKNRALGQMRTNLEMQNIKYQALLAKLRSQKAKIKSLTGMKLHLLTSLKEALGEKIDIDKKSGSLRLASNILFGSGEAVLKPEAKVELKKAFEEYIGTLVRDPKIKPYLDKIIIEGHTDSVGSYIYNLNLSQKRALAVMEYLLTLDFTKQHNIRPLMIASGRAYLDRVMLNGVEDKEASRRIEIKFRLKNEDAMEEIERVLDAK